jgi:hypothetical protein
MPKKTANRASNDKTMALFYSCGGVVVVVWCCGGVGSLLLTAADDCCCCTTTTTTTTSSDAAAFFCRAAAALTAAAEKFTAHFFQKRVPQPQKRGSLLFYWSEAIYCLLINLLTRSNKSLYNIFIKALRVKLF